MRILWIFVLIILVSSRLARSDEGMWLYNNPPRKLIHERYGFDLEDPWLEHLQKSSVRFGAGGSAEFVSQAGLILSNHHVGARALQRLSSKEHNYLRDGFYARTHAEEKRCEGTEVRVLMNMEDVTDRVNSSVTPDMPDQAAFLARRAVIATIEKESLEKTGFQSDVVTLFQGGQYQLYRFKKYTDVRLVFAPEEQIAFFGGDPDNFEYPRFDLDICIFRAYENGRPARPEHYLKWSANGPLENDLVFVSGHPGHTDRMRTIAELELIRDLEYPQVLRNLKRREVLLSAYSARSAENARRARTDLFGVKNSRKVRTGALAGILDPKFIESKARAENQLRSAVAANPALSNAIPAWERIAEAQKVIASKILEYPLLERSEGFDSVLFNYARELLRAAEEHAKPNGERLEEFRDSAKASFEHGLFAEQPVYSDLETLKLADSLTFLAEGLGYAHPLVQKVLAGKSPRDRAAEAVAGTKLASAAVRKELYRAGKNGVEGAHDTMIDLARLVDPDARAVRLVIEPQHEAIRQAHAQIARARYTLTGGKEYPDATSSLRLAFGVVKGYEQEGQHIPFETTFAGLYERSREQNNRPPFDLPPHWVEKKARLKLATPLNFVCTADIIGGNSGSPVVNRKGEFVGVIFDGNIQSLTDNFLYTETQQRALAVHSSGIIEALRKVYEADGLVEELIGGGN